MDNLSQSLQDVITSLLIFLPKAITALVIFAVSFYIARLAERFVTGTLHNRNISRHVIRLLSQISRWGIIVLGTVTALQQVDFDLTAFVAGLGITGFVLGFALQDIAQNFVAGLLLLIQQPFKPGDIIEVAGYYGRVEAVDMRITHIRTLDGLDVLIPNGKVYGNPLINYTLSPPTRTHVTVGVAYGSRAERVSEVALAAIKKVPIVLETPAPQIVIGSFGDSSVNVEVYYWYDAVQTPPLKARDGAMRAIYAAFAENNIEIPFPIRTVYMNTVDKEKL